VKIHARDYAMVTACSRLAPLLRIFGDTETWLARGRLEKISIHRPVFIAGLARSGTTLILNLLAGADGVATHRYRDFPLLWAPLSWNWLQDLTAHSDDPVERPHGDRIRITQHSAEAFEEPIWQHFFPQAHDPQHDHILDRATSAPEFEAFFQDHLKKILLLRGGTRYVSKANYNIARIEYLAKLFPDARFIVPVREPLSQVHSLVRQHRRFTDYAASDNRVGEWLRAAGHYEFGPQRQPQNLGTTCRAAAQAFEAGDDYRGYASQWAAVYAYVTRLRGADGLAGSLKVVRYEDFCARPAAELTDILGFAGLSGDVDTLLRDHDPVSAPPAVLSDLPAEICERVRAQTADVAREFGYTG